jgi:hypothetical protein
VYAINLSLSTDLVDPYSENTFSVKPPLPALNFKNMWFCDQSKSGPKLCVQFWARLKKPALYWTTLYFDKIPIDISLNKCIYPVYTNRPQTGHKLVANRPQTGRKLVANRSKTGPKTHGFTSELNLYLFLEKHDSLWKIHMFFTWFFFAG